MEASAAGPASVVWHATSVTIITLSVAAHTAQDGQEHVLPDDFILSAWRERLVLSLVSGRAVERRTVQLEPRLGWCGCGKKDDGTECLAAHYLRSHARIRCNISGCGWLVVVGSDDCMGAADSGVCSAKPVDTTHSLNTTT